MLRRPVSQFASHLRPLADRLAAGELSLIGIGPECITAAIIEMFGLRIRSYPFDWLFSSLPMIEHCLRDDFRAFLDPAQYETVPLAERTTPTTNRTHHRLYRDRFGVNYVFNHHEMPDGLEHFQRAAGKFRGAVRPHLLHVVRRPAPDLADQVARFAEVVPGAQVLAIRVLPAGDQPRGVRETASGARWSVHDMRAAAPLRSLAFGAEEDEAMFADFLLGRFGHPQTAAASLQIT